MENADQLDRSPAALPLKRLNLVSTLAICSIGWLVPGLGHLLLRRWVRGVILSACVLLMFVLGMGMSGKLYDTAIEQPLHIFALIADLGVGLPYFIAQRLGLGAGALTENTYEYGTTYLWVSGLLNYLIVLDAFDIAQGRKP
jgi:hypothetical protein